MDVIVLATEIHRRPSKRERRRDLNAALVSGSQQLKSLQDRSNEDREDVYRALDAMDEVLNKARTSDGFETAKSEFASVPPLMVEARLAASELPQVTADIVSLARAMSRDISQLEELVSDPVQVEYLQALDDALSQLVQTHGIYAEMNRVIAQGISLYERLITVTRDVFAEYDQGGFRSRREASRSYSSRTEELVGPIRAFNEQLSEVQARADSAARQAVEAFAEAERIKSGAAR